MRKIVGIDITNIAIEHLRKKGSWRAEFPREEAWETLLCANLPIMEGVSRWGLLHGKPSQLFEMRIVNLQVEKDIDQGKPIKLDLGSGKSGRRGFYAVDHLELDGVDIVADLNEPLDLLPDNSVEYVFSQHALEHVPRLLPLLREIFRITKRNGFIEVVVPHFSNPYCYSDPTHIRFFGLYSMYYFVDESKQPAIRKVPSFYSDVRFDIESIRIEFYQLSMIDKLIVPFLSRLVNRNIRWQNFYERRLSSLFHSWQLRFLMRPEK